jgi:hypothetical protein
MVALLCAAQSSDLANQMWEAARKGDAKAVEALLDKGVDVNSKFRYDATALSYACDRGHVEVVKVLLNRGANPNVTDTFYKATPLTWAAQKGHTEIVKLLLEKGAQGKDNVLNVAVMQKNAAMAEAVLAMGGLSQTTLNNALARAQRNNDAEMADRLLKAGAKPHPEVKVDPEILKQYAGTYRAENAPELIFAVKDGSLTGGPAGQALKLGAIDRNTFRPLEFDGITLTFRWKEDKVTGLDLKQGERTTAYQKVEGQ